ncbi:hypothetical protein Esti_004821 [Eimeria stiedai]
MGNPRHLRRASSEDEDEGDVFDDKSEISSGSDEEEEALSRGKAADASSSPSQGTHAVSQPETSAPATTAGQCRDSSAASAAHDNREVRDGAENGTDEKVHPQAIDRPRGEVTREDGNRRRMKTIWQLMQEDPSFVPRETRYFLHDDRRDGEEEEAEELYHSQPDFSVPRSSQTRVGPSRKLWTPDEDKDVWKHDMWEKLQKEEAECRTTAHNWNRGRPGRRGGYNGYGRGGREDKWFPRGYRESRFRGGEGDGNESCNKSLLGNPSSTVAEDGSVDLFARGGDTVLIRHSSSMLTLTANLRFAVRI